MFVFVRTCHQTDGVGRGHPWAGVVVGRDRDIVDLATDHVEQGAGGVGGVTGRLQALLAHNLYRVVAGPLVHVPDDLGDPHAVLGVHVERDAGL